MSLGTKPLLLNPVSWRWPSHEYAQRLGCQLRGIGPTLMVLAKPKRHRTKADAVERNVLSPKQGPSNLLGRQPSGIAVDSFSEGLPRLTEPQPSAARPQVAAVGRLQFVLLFFRVFRIVGANPHKKTAKGWIVVFVSPMIFF